MQTYLLSLESLPYYSIQHDRPVSTPSTGLHKSAPTRLLFVKIVSGGEKVGTYIVRCLLGSNHNTSEFALSRQPTRVLASLRLTQWSTVRWSFLSPKLEPGSRGREMCPV